MRPGTPHLSVIPRELAALSSGLPSAPSAVASAKPEALAKADHPPCFHTLVNSFTPPRKFAPMFSHTYKLIFPQIPYFDILTNCRGRHPLGAAKRAIFALRTRLNLSRFMLLRTL